MRAWTYQWLGEAASDVAPTAQNIFFLGNRMPERVPESAIKFYEDRLVIQFRAADEQRGHTPISPAARSPSPFSVSTRSMSGEKR